MDDRTEFHAVLAELVSSAERAEAALQQVELRRDPRLMPPPGMIATMTLAALPATVAKRLTVRPRRH